MYEFIEDRWHKDSVYQQAVSREGHTLDPMRRWCESGPTIGDDQELYNLLRRKREGVFTGSVVTSDVILVDLTHASTSMNTFLQKHASIRSRSQARTEPSSSSSSSKLKSVWWSHWSWREHRAVL